MPIYEYVCAVCRHRADILHGVHEPGPNFCLECGSEGSMRKAFAPPTIVFKGSGWAKKERRSGASSRSSKGSSDAEGATGKPSSASDNGSTKAEGTPPASKGSDSGPSGGED
jgi:putative FmdB family regulatory protein